MELALSQGDWAEILGDQGAARAAAMIKRSWTRSGAGLALASLGYARATAPAAATENPYAVPGPE